MKHVFYTTILFLVLGTANSQNIFWTESFGIGCDQGTLAAGYNPGMGTWDTTMTGNNDPLANLWFISATESGMGLGACGDGCLGTGTTNRTLHIGDMLSPDNGASYAAGPGLFDTDVRAESPIINCTGQNTITLSFLYILGGVAGSDFFDIQYSSNGGATWTVISTPPQTPPICPGGQGLWTSFSVALPASANNNPNVKIGFRWQNTDPSGADPSVAIDDMKLTSLSPAVFAPTFTLPTSLCAGKTTTVTASTGTFAVSGYTWSSSPAGPTFGSPNASVSTITFSNAGTFSITLTATSGTTTASNMHTITINPTPTLTPVASPSAICSGNASTLSVTGGNTYTWNPGALTGSNIAVNPTVTTVYTVTGASAAGCTATAVKNISVTPAPNLTVSANPASICSGQSSTLSVSGGSTYTWNPGALTGSSVVVSPTTSTIYTVTGTSAAGCTGSAVQSVSVGTSLSLSVMASSSTLCVGSSGTLIAIGATSYTWNPGALSGSSVVVSPTVNTTYTVNGSTAGCSGSGSISINVFTCSVGLMTNSANANGYSVYPNPVSDKLYVLNKNNVYGEINFEILDALGKCVMKQSYISNGNTGVYSLDVNSLPSGVYFVRIISNKSTNINRFIKE